MKWPLSETRTRFNLLGVIILLAGLGSAVFIYQRAEPRPEGVLGYEEAGGTFYPVRPEDSKQYLRQMELYGGKANVLVDEFRRWFAGLWQGKSLARIIAGAAVIIALGLFLAARRLPAPLPPAAARGNPEGSDTKPPANDMKL